MRKKVCGSSQATSTNGSGPSSYQIHPIQTYTHSSEKKQKELYACSKCNKSFVYSRHLEKHLQGHGRNDCQFCNELFSSKRSLILHMREKHGKIIRDSKHSCNFCKKAFTRRKSLYSHLRCHANGQEVCLTCGEFLANKEVLTAHIKVHEDSQLSCPLCHQTFSRQQQYTRHMQMHDKYRCLTCERGFSSYSVLLQHQQEGHEVINPVSHKCSLCNKAFSRPSTLQNHLANAHSDKSFYCKTCNKTFSKAEGLRCHIKTESHLALISKATSGEQGYVCENCGKHFMYQQSLNSHRMRAHPSKKNFSCEFCPHSTNFKANLTRHIRLHLNERHFVCEQCGDAFYVLSALKDHYLFLHSDSREHACDKCSKKFKRSSDLKRHLRTHSDARPHVCECCNRSFKRSWHLKRHKEKFHNQVCKTRQVQRLRQDDNGKYHPVLIESKSKKNKKQNNIIDTNAQYVLLPYSDAGIVSIKQITINDSTDSKDISTLSLGCAQDLTRGTLDLTTVPSTHFLVSTPSSETSLLYLQSASMSSVNPEPTVDNDIPRDGEALELLKPPHYHGSNSELNSHHMLLAPHDITMQNVLGADVKLSDSMIDDVAEPRQPSPSSNYLNEISSLYG